MSNQSDDTIWIVTSQSSDEYGSKTGSKAPPYYQNNPPVNRENAVPVKASKLEAELSKFLAVVGGLFNRAQEQVNQQTGFKLDEIQLSVEISGEGEIKLLGTGVKTETKGGLTFTFKRDD